MLNKKFILKIWVYQKLYLNLQKNLKQYEYIDKECPARNYLSKGWKSEFSILTFNDLWIEMNEFIINSNFWTKYRANQ